MDSSSFNIPKTELLFQLITSTTNNPNKYFQHTCACYRKTNIKYSVAQIESFQPPYRIILNKRKYTRQIPSTTGHSHRLISNPRSIHGRSTFPIPSYPPIYLFTGCRCRRDAVPARSHERKSYEPKEKLRQWQGARPARSRAHVDVYARVKSSSLSLTRLPTRSFLTQPSFVFQWIFSLLFQLPRKHISPPNRGEKPPYLCLC